MSTQILTEDEQRKKHFSCMFLHLWRWIYQRELLLVVREGWRAVKANRGR